jgi:hypothetical protein
MLLPTDVEDGRQNDAWHRVPLKRLLPPLTPGSAEYLDSVASAAARCTHVVLPRDIGREERDCDDGWDRLIKATNCRGERLSLLRPWWRASRLRREERGENWDEVPVLGSERFCTAGNCRFSGATTERHPCASV